MAETLLNISSLVIGYPDRILSSPIHLELPRGANLGIIGGNGTGKSTLIKTLMGLIVPLSGSYRWSDESRLGYVPQESQVDTLVPLTVEDLLKMGLYPELPRFRARTGAMDARIDDALAEMGIEHLLATVIRNLSSGERQRALIARAWISRPSVLVMDEPFNFLDYPFKEKLWKKFEAWQLDQALSVILIDHDLNRIVNQVQFLIVLGPQGTAFGPTRDVLQPAILSEIYGAPVHVHQENGSLQVHIL